MRKLDILEKRDRLNEKKDYNLKKQLNENFFQNNIRCHLCGTVGHVARNCHLNGPAQGSSNQQQTNQQRAPPPRFQQNYAPRNQQNHAGNFYNQNSNPYRGTYMRAPRPTFQPTAPPFQPTAPLFQPTAPPFQPYQRPTNPFQRTAPTYQMVAPNSLETIIENEPQNTQETVNTLIDT